MKIHFVRAILFTAVALFFSVSCDRDDDTPSDPASTPLHTIIVDANIAQKLQSIDSNGTLTFNGLTAEETPEKGGIICSAPIDKAPLGFFYGVKSVTKNGKITVVETQYASIADAVGKGSISAVSAAGSINDLVISETLLDGVSLAGSFTGGEYKVCFDAVVVERQTTNLKLSCAISGKLDLTVSGSFNALPAQSAKRILTTIEAAPITFIIGKIPVVITPTIPIALQLDCDGTFNGTLVTTNHTYSVETGIQYENKKLIMYSRDNSPVARPILTGLNAIIDGSLVTALNAGARLQIYNHAPAAINASIGFYGKAETFPHIQNSEKIGIIPVLSTCTGKTGKVDAEIKDFGLNANINAADTINENLTLKQNVFPEFSPLAFSNITATSFTAQTSVASATLNFIFPVAEYGLCWSNSAQPDIHTDAHTSFGALNATGTSLIADITMDNSHLYIYPYFTNAFGTFYGNGKYRGETISPCQDTLTVEAGGTSVTWACANCGDPETFVSPENAGSYYRWNRLGWNDQLEEIPEIGKLWSVNPCPDGFALPSIVDITSLSGVLSECVTEVDGHLAEGYCYRSPDGRYLFFPRSGYLDENGAINNRETAYIILNYWLHTHTMENYTELLTYYGIINNNSFYFHAIVPLTKEPAGAGYPVRCIYLKD
ncbi:MAG: hypothetical protein LBG77_04195 [Dysgonamonadaceae bacterium]|jgi:hypothetical protein|nr:hypothetical protein [Dysgonamonadaceae bacterium]